jgi:DNA-binding transcriptional LysR family regulator
MLRLTLMLNSDDLAFFAVVSDSRTLADAARKLDITPSAVTQRLKSIETRAGVRLFERSGRHLAVTDDGVLVASHGAIVAEAMTSLTEALRDRSMIVSGHLRVVAPSGFGRAHVAKVVADFARRYSMVTVSLELSDRPSARLIESHDVIVHIGPPPPSTAIITSLAANRRMLCASPKYLENAPPLDSPEDLLAHRCIVLRENDEDVTLWRLRARERAVALRVRPAMSTNDGSLTRAWAIAGLGIIMRSEWEVAEDLRTDRLRLVLPGWEPPAADVIAILGARQGRTGRSKAFLAELRRALSPPPWCSLRTSDELSNV